jgi:hypothetical protein
MGLSSPVPVIRLLAVQSLCFNVVEHGQALTRMEQERVLATSGRLQTGSNVGQGQIVAANYYITPNVVFSEGNAAAISSALGGAYSRRQ